MTSVQIHTEQREFTVHREVPILYVELSKSEVDKIILEHVRKTIIPKQPAVADREQAQLTIKPDIDWRHEEYDGFHVEVVFAH